jgi:hypothetical protein
MRTQVSWWPTGVYVSDSASKALQRGVVVPGDLRDVFKVALKPFGGLST